MNFFRCAGVTLLFLTFSASGCGVNVPADTPIDTTSTASSRLQQNGSATTVDSLPPDLTIRDVSNANLVQVCLDQSRELVEAEPDAGKSVLQQVALLVRKNLASSEGYTNGLLFEAFPADDRGLASPIIARFEIADAKRIRLKPGGNAKSRQAERKQQRGERIRASLVNGQFGALESKVNTSSLSTSQTSDIFGCISRANRSAAGFDQKRRLLIIVSSFSVDRLASDDLLMTKMKPDLRSLLLVEVGPYAEQRRGAWTGTWKSMNISAVYPLPFVDVRDGALRQHLEYLKQGV